MRTSDRLDPEITWRQQAAVNAAAFATLSAAHLERPLEPFEEVVQCGFVPCRACGSVAVGVTVEQPLG